MVEDKIDELIKELTSSEVYGLWLPASEALIKIGEPSVPALTELLKDDYEVARSTAAGVLGKIGSVKAVPALINALKDEDEDVRGDAAEALGKIRDVRAVPALIDALNDENAGMRLTAAEALGKIRDVRAVPALIDALKDEDADVRGYAAQALGKIIPSLTDIRLREMKGLLMKALENAEVKDALWEVYKTINNRRNALLEPEVKKLKLPKRIKRKGKPKRRMWRIPAG